MSNTVGYSLGCVTPVRYNLTQGEDVTGNMVGFSLPACVPPLIGDESITLSTTSQSSTPTLIGFDEFYTQSSPPKKYLKKTGSGTFYRCLVNGSCESLSIYGSDSSTLDGVDEYDTSGGWVTRGSNSGKQSFFTCPATTPLYDYVGLPGPFSASAYVWSTLETSKTLSKRVAGVCGPSEMGGVYVHPSGFVQIELSKEDTEADAIARAATTPGTETVALRTARTTGFSFDFTTVEAALSCTNLAPSLCYRVSYDIKKTDLGTLAATLTPYVVDIPENSASYDLAPVALVPDSGFSLELVNYKLSTR